MANANTLSNNEIILGIIGTRYYNDYEQLENQLDIMFPSDGPVKISTIVSGGARGADALAERYAKERGIKLIVHRAEWDKHASKYIAAYTRNKEIVNDCDQIVAFWDGKSTGTKMTIGIAKKNNVPVTIFRYDQK